MHILRLGLAIALLTVTVPLPVSAQPINGTQPQVSLQGPDYYRFPVGTVAVTALTDGSVPQDLHSLLRGTTNAKTDALLKRSFLRNPIEASINVFLLELPNRLVLVDTGSGELFGPGYGGKLLDSLKAAGFRPDQITDILLTHIHIDHSGGLVHDGKRVFPNARVHVGKPDVDFFLSPENSVKTGYDRKYFDVAIQTAKPYVDAGQVDTFTGSSEIIPGITASLHPGHTPGSAFYTLVSQGERITFIGDVIHVASVQFPDPTITIIYDQNPAKAEASREQAFAELSGSRSLIAAPHLPFPGVGHIRPAGKGYDWVPVEYTNRQVN